MLANHINGGDWVAGLSFAAVVAGVAFALAWWATRPE